MPRPLASLAPTLVLAAALTACATDDAPPDVEPPDPLADASVESAVPAPDPGAPADGPDGAIAPDEASFTATVPEGYTQQLPDEALGGQDPMPADDALAAAAAVLDSREALLGDGVVLVAGMDSHGVPLEPENPDPAALPPDTPAILADPAAVDPVTTYADCMSLLRNCAQRTTSMDLCVDSVPVCGSDKPWTRGEHCCPAAARDDYRAQRAAGRPWGEAFLDAIVNGTEHFEGLEAIYEEGGLR